MATVVLTTFISVDGVVQAPGGPDEDRDGNFEQGGWFVPFVDGELMEMITEWTEQADGLLLGRKTYDIFAASWPQSTNPEDRIGVHLNRVPKYVASTTLRTLSGTTPACSRET